MLTATKPAMRGIPTSRGVATGPARIILVSEDFNAIRLGDIVVCHALTTASPIQLGAAGGIITETGGALSNSATIARERGIPVVTAFEGATTRIRDGQMVTIDGATGVVSL